MLMRIIVGLFIVLGDDVSKLHCNLTHIHLLSYERNCRRLCSAKSNLHTYLTMEWDDVETLFINFGICVGSCFNV